MIPRDYITEWRQSAPWVEDAQVEQDLVISRALVEIFNEPLLAESLAFRGGTALYKLHMKARRYSEDIDLVQTQPGPIGAAIDALRATLDPWLGPPRRKLNEGRVILIYRFASEDIPPRPLRLKVEINSREHFSVFPIEHRQHAVLSRWFNGAANICTYHLDELLGTKLRALYQRKKSRDLFDLWHALKHHPVSAERILAAFHKYMDELGLRVSRAEFEANLADKLADPRFRADLTPLLAPGEAWNIDDGHALVHREIVMRLPGAPWAGRTSGT